ILEAREQLVVKAEGKLLVRRFYDLFQHIVPPTGPTVRHRSRQVHTDPSGALTRAKVSSAVAATWPSTVALASPMPTGPFCLVRVHSISSTSPGVTWRRKRAFLMPPNRSSLSLFYCLVERANPSTL